MAAHSSILAWKIPWTEEPGGLHSPWGHKESDTTEHARRLDTYTSACVCYSTLKKRQFCHLQQYG